MAGKLATYWHKMFDSKYQGGVNWAQVFCTQSLPSNCIALNKFGRQKNMKCGWGRSLLAPNLFNPKLVVSFKLWEFISSGVGGSCPKMKPVSLNLFLFCTFPLTLLTTLQENPIQILYDPKSTNTNNFKVRLSYNGWWRRLGWSKNSL